MKFLFEFRKDGISLGFKEFDVRDGNLAILAAAAHMDAIGAAACRHVTDLMAQEDAELLSWLLGIANNKPHRAGDFLHALADAALRADCENYPLMRPFLLEMKKKYPQYSFTEADSLAAGELFTGGS